MSLGIQIKQIGGGVIGYWVGLVGLVGWVVKGGGSCAKIWSEWGGGTTLDAVGGYWVVDLVVLRLVGGGGYGKCWLGGGGKGRDGFLIGTKVWFGVVFYICFLVFFSN